MTQEFVTLPREVVEQALKALSLALSDVDWRKDSPTQPVIHKAYNATCAALEQPQCEQEPVATVNRLGTIYLTQAGCGMQPGTRLYTHPQPKREPLKNERIRLIESSTHFHESRCWAIRFARAIEAAHNIVGEA